MDTVYSGFSRIQLEIHDLADKFDSFTKQTIATLAKHDTDIEYVKQGIEKLNDGLEGVRKLVLNGTANSLSSRQMMVESQIKTLREMYDENIQSSRFNRRIFWIQVGILLSFFTSLLSVLLKVFS